MPFDYKLLFTLLGVIVTLGAYYLYIRDIFFGENKPHMYSWLIWGSLLLTGTYIQGNYDGGWGTYVTLTEGIFCFIVAAIAYKKGEKEITKSDTMSLIGAGIAICLLFVFKQPYLTIILIIIIDLLGCLPTIRKSYKNPNQESVGVYIAGAIIFTFSIIGLAEYSFLTFAYPFAIVLLDSFLVIIILSRRKKLSV